MKHDLIKLHMIVLMQSDLKKAVEFYKDLGIKQKIYVEGKLAEFDLGCAKLALCQTDQVQDNIRTGVVLELFEDLHVLAQKLKAKGVHFLQDPVDVPYSTMASCKDPGGNIIDFYQATPERYQDFLKQQKENSDKDK